ncbi:TniQ family protein, partial [Ruminococcaceae bacterium OttesenSCG-928-I18]|nr:TniQ family protein [Ruminococcaceae bacterium OttesenSCG-928-I18]
IRSGNLSGKHSSIDIFGFHKQKVSVELATDLKYVLSGLPVGCISAETILSEHTLFPYYSRFWRTERKTEVVAALINGGDDAAVHRVGIYQSAVATQVNCRYCPQCFDEDLTTYGEPYWHRLHQLADLRLCVRHRCWLADTGIPLRDSNKILSPALPDMALADTPQEPPAVQEIALSALYAETLTLPLSKRNGRVYIDVFDAELKRQGWRSPTGKNTRTKALSEAMRDFYDPFVSDNDISSSRLNSTLSASKNPAPRYILQAAFFFGISLDGLFTKPKEIDVVKEINSRLAVGESQRSIGRRLNIDPATVRRWANKRTVERR